MGIKILKASFWGVLVVFLFLCMLSFILPWRFGGWMDGFPFGSASSAPGFIIGSLIGGVVGVIIGKRISKIEKSVFIGSVCGGVIGAFISWFALWGYFELY